MSMDLGKVSVDNGRSRGELKRIKRNHGGAVLSGGMVLLGLTVTEFKFIMRVNVKVISIANNRYCALAESVESSIGYPQFTIYIDRKYRRGGCQNSVIRAHEDTHVALYRRNLETYAPLLKRRLKNAVRQLRPLIVRSPQGGAERVKNRLNLKIKSLIREMQRKVDAENATIDTKQSYRAIRRSCSDW